MMGLRESVVAVLRKCGADVLLVPNRFVALVTDNMDGESVEARVLYTGCDERFLAYFVKALNEGTSVALADAASQAAEYLNREHIIDPRAALRASWDIAGGCADFYQIELPGGATRQTPTVVSTPPAEPRYAAIPAGIEANAHRAPASGTQVVGKPASAPPPRLQGDMQRAQAATSPSPAKSTSSKGILQSVGLLLAVSAGVAGVEVLNRLLFGWNVLAGVIEVTILTVLVIAYRWVSGRCRIKRSGGYAAMGLVFVIGAGARDLLLRTVFALTLGGDQLPSGGADWLSNEWRFAPEHQLGYSELWMPMVWLVLATLVCVLLVWIFHKLAKPQWIDRRGPYACLGVLLYLTVRMKDGLMSLVEIYRYNNGSNLTWYFFPEKYACYVNPLLASLVCLSTLVLVLVTLEHVRGILSAPTVQPKA